MDSANALSSQEVASAAVSILTNYNKDLQDIKIQVVNTQAKVTAAIESFKQLC